MKKIYTLFLALCTVLLFSQKQAGYKEYFMEGSYLLLENEPEKALENFEKAYTFDSTSANINYLLGVAYMESPSDKRKAERHLEIAVQNISNKYKSDDYKEKSAPPLAQYYYAKALHLNYKFDQALDELEAFKTTVNPKDLEYVKMVEREITAGKLAKQMTAYPLNVKIANLGENINSPYPDYSAVLSGDERTIIFTTRRPENTGNMKDSDGSEFEDIVVSYKDDKGNWSKPVPLGINTIGHEASINLSADGQTLIVYKNEAGGENPAGNGNLYYTVFDGKDWASLQEFGSDVNTLYMESHACLSADGNVLFFSSERPGGLGGKDIYRCIKLPHGKWSKALNMGPEINTEYDEDGGFIHPDGRTFYFASNGHQSMGGFDILYAILNEENKFSDVTNIGYPINTTDDDLFFVTSPDAKRGYFASAKEGGMGDKDIYQITFEKTRETYLALFKGQILAAEGNNLPDNISIVVTDKESNEVVGVYRPKLVNGTFSTILPPGKEYNFSYQANEGGEFYSEDVFVSNEYAYQEIKREVSLEPVIVGQKIKAVKNTIVLNTIVLDNYKDKKPIAGAKITVEEQGAGKQVFTCNDAGAYNGIVLLANRKYSLFAEVLGVTSETSTINTQGADIAKSLNEIIYMEKKAKAQPSKNILLDIAVKHPNTKKSVSMVNITLTDESGAKTELVTDEKGLLKAIALVPEMKYKVLAYKDNFASNIETFKTGKDGKLTRIPKTIMLAYEAPIVAGNLDKDTSAANVGAANRYEFHFGYGFSTIDQNDSNFKNFIDYAVALSKEQAQISISIDGSASHVPMRKAGGNPKLAETRAEDFKTLITNALAAKGLSASKIKFSLNSSVNGPEYRGDYISNRKVYQKYQFVRAKIH